MDNLIIGIYDIFRFDLLSSGYIFKNKYKIESINNILYE